MGLEQQAVAEKMRFDDFIGRLLGACKSDRERLAVSSVTSFIELHWGMELPETQLKTLMNQLGLRSP